MRARDVHGPGDRQVRDAHGQRGPRKLLGCHHLSKEEIWRSQFRLIINFIKKIGVYLVDDYR